MVEHRLTEQMTEWKHVDNRSSQPRTMWIDVIQKPINESDWKPGDWNDKQ